jgi:hypothetical protein
MYLDPCSETTAYGEERPLKQCDISEVVLNVAVIALWSYCRGLCTNPEAKLFPGISPLSIALIVIPIRERHSWNVIGNKPIPHSEWQSEMGFFQTMRHWRCGRLLDYVRFSKEALGGE